MKKTILLSIICLFGPLFSNAQSGAALNFDGVNDQIALNSFSISGSAARTIEFWIKTSNTGSFQNPFSSGSANQDQAFNIKVTPSGYLGLMGFNNDIYPSSGTYITDNNFHHVAITYNGTTARAYVDGNHEWDFATILNTVGENNYIGQSNHNGNEQYFGGTIDELRVWNIVRSQCEIISYKNCEIPASAAGLVANYHFNQGVDGVNNSTETTLTDVSGNANDGMLINFALTGMSSNWVAPGAVVSGFNTPTICPSGSALNFDGSNDEIDLGNSVCASLDPLNTITVEAWVNPSTTTWLGVIAGNYSTTGSGMQFLLRRDNDEYAFWVDDGNGFKVVTSGPAVSVGSWQHVAGVWDGSKLMVYVNGVLKATTTGINGPGFPSSSNNVWLGGNSINESFMGDIDEVRIWSNVRTACEINTYMNSEISNPMTGLLANYHFNQGLASYSNPGETTLLDVSGNGNNGTLGNFSLTGSTSNWITPGGVVNGYTTTLPALVASKGSNNALCNGGAGSGTLTASGGTAPYTYLWSTGATTSVTALMAGAHSATVTDAASCITIKNFGITEPTAIVAGSSASSILCNGGIANVTVTATGGTLPYVSPGTYTTLAGTHTYTVIDNNGCAATTSITVNEPTILSAGSAASSILCNGGSADVTVTAAGGSASYIGVGTFTAMAGTSIYTVTDANGCMATTSITLTEPIILTAGSAASSILCNGGLADVTVTATGGTASYVGVGTYTAMGGTTTYTITDTNGCIATTSITLTEPAILSGGSAASSILCNGGSASVTVTATGGTGSYIGVGTYTAMAGTTTYTITDANSCTTTTSITISEPAAIVLSQTISICEGQSIMVGTSTYTTAGIYSDVVFSLINGCDSTITSDIRVNNLPVISVNSGTICSGQSFTMVPSGAATYTYSNGTDVVTPTSDATYSVSGTDANGCVSSTDAISNVTVNVLPVISVNSGTICAGQSFTMVPSGAITFTYSNGSDVDMPASDATYTVTGTDANGCENMATSSVTVNALPVLSATTTNTLMCTGETTTLSVTGASSYTWSTGETTTDIVVTPTTQASYTVEGTDANGCSNSTTITQDVSLCTGILSVSNSQLLNVYPNPSNGLFVIDLNSLSNVIVTNALGQVILTETMEDGKHSLDIQNQSAGIYFVKVIQDGKQHTIKLIKE